MLIAQALVERGLIESLVSTVVGIPRALDAQLGPGNARWVIGAVVLVFLFWALRPRR